MAEPSSGKLYIEYFFGFSRFLRFQESREKSLNKPEGEHKEKDLFCSLPTEIQLPDFKLVGVSWANIFYLNEKTRNVKVIGRHKARDVLPEENISLPLDKKIVTLSARWGRLLLVTDEGDCHVISKVHDDWTVSRVTSCDSGNRGKMLIGSLGDTHCITVDECGKVYEIKTDEIDVNERSNFLSKTLLMDVKIDQVACGKEHVLLLHQRHGTVYSFGLGSRGQLGLGTANPETTPARIEALAGIKITQIASGGWHSLALSEFGDIYAWGWNNCGQLGITCVPPEVPASLQMLPYLVDFPTEQCVVTNIACGTRHSVAVTSDTEVWTWGWGYYGQLGHGDREDRKTPALVEYFKNITLKITGVTCGPWQTVVHMRPFEV